MSSETSTEPQAGATADADSLQPWQLFTLAGLIGATLTVFMSRGQSPSAVILLSLTIFAAAAVGIAALRTFIPLTGRLPDDAGQVLGGRTRAALEREKTLVLRSIKDLEFDRAMGKLSEKDFTEMSGRLRVRAAGLIRQLDAGTGYREQIEQELERRIGKSEAARAAASAGPNRLRQGAGGPPELYATAEEQGPAYPVCNQCRTSNDVDARFCKSCGAKIEARS
jgi:hypothetical protein